MPEKIFNIINSIKELLVFLYSQDNQKYFLEVKWLDNNTNILIREQFAKTSILNINIPGKIDTYTLVSKGIINTVINNSDIFGCLTTSFFNGERKIQGQMIRTNNVEINLPIYSHVGLAYAEKTNNIMLNKLDNSKVKEKKFIK